MWKPEHRAAADRRGLRYDSDLTDAEWALVAPLIRPAKRGGRPRTVNVREVLNAIFYVLWTGCQWKALPKDFPPRSTVWDYLDLWELYVEVRETAGREASPTTAIIDSQSVKGDLKGGSRSTRPGMVRAIVKTPRWLRYVIRTPELHSIHHELNVHKYNFADLPIWDRLFGTYKDAEAFAERCGFPGEAERKLGRMLMFKDVYNG